MEGNTPPGPVPPSNPGGQENTGGLSETISGGEKNSLAEGLDRDPRFDTIKQELVTAWEKAHGNRWEGSTLRPEFQDYVHGNAAEFRSGRKPDTLDERAKAVFGERFPQDAQEYASREQERVYENPNDDPALKTIEKTILEETNRDSEVTAARQNYQAAWNRSHARASIRAWDSFIAEHPQKAAAYRDRYEPIRRAFEGQERLRIYQEQQTTASESPAPLSASTETTGRLATTDATGEEPSEGTPAPQPPEQFDPVSLLETPEMSVDEFFGLDKDAVYARLHPLQSLPVGNPNREKAMKILEMLLEGRDKFLGGNPGATVVNLSI